MKNDLEDKQPSRGYSGSICQRLASLNDTGVHASYGVSGKLVKVSGGRLEASGIKAGIGARCTIKRDRLPPLDTEVIGFDGDRLILASVDMATGVVPGAVVKLEEKTMKSWLVMLC